MGDHVGDGDIGKDKDIITNCVVYGVVPMQIMFARSAIVLAHILMNLAQQ